MGEARGGEAFRLVWVRVAVPVIGTVFLFLVAAFFYYLPALRGSLMQQKRDSLRNLTRTAWSVLESYRGLEISGELSGEAARARAALVISQMRFGADNKDYFWINDLHPRMVMHPYRPDLNGQDLTNYTDRAGLRLFVACVEATKATGEGFVHYYWQWQDDPRHVVPKLSFVKRFEPWGWIVGTGVYIEDVEAEASAQAAKLVKAGLAVFLLASILALVSILQGRQADIRLRRGRDKMRAIFDQSFQFMAFLDLQGRLLEINSTALAVHGLRERDVQGRYFWDTPWWDHSPATQDEVRHAVREASAGRAVRWQTGGPDGRGVHLDVFVSIKPALDSAGQVFGIIAEGQDVTAQMAARRERERSHAELEARNRELERVAYVVSHDLRNPLVTIKGFIGVLRQAQEQGDEERAGLALRRVDQAADRVGGLLEDLTTLFRLGHLDIRREFVNLEDLLREVEQGLARELAARQGEIRRVTPLPTVSADRDRLREVFQNLLENAVAFARPDAPLRIEVGSLEDAEGYEIFVRDNGMGIRPAYLEKIFGLFEQLSPNGRGTGVGLTLVRRIIEQHGGRIWAESEGEGAGTTVRFTLPLPGEEVEEGAGRGPGREPEHGEGDDE